MSAGGRIEHIYLSFVPFTTVCHSRMEFITIISIMVFMTVWDFVIGVLFGIIVSCEYMCMIYLFFLTFWLQGFFFVVQNSQRRSIRVLHTGESVMSTVRRPGSQRAYIREVSKQTTILRLQGAILYPPEMKHSMLTVMPSRFLILRHHHTRRRNHPQHRRRRVVAS